MPEPWDEITNSEKQARGLLDSSEAPIIPISLDGYIPNSVILRLLWPMELFEILESESAQSVESKLELQVESKTESQVESGDSKEVEISELSAEHSSILLQKLEDMEQEQLKGEDQSGSAVKMPLPVVEKKRKLPTSDMRKELLIRRSSSQVQTTGKQIPLPTFITMFQGTAWFDKLFPHPDASIFPPDLTDLAFAEMLIMMLGTVDYDVKEGIASSLVFLLQSRPPKLTTMAHDALITALNGPDPPNHKNQQQRDFIRTALWALKELMPNSQELLMELMAQYLQSDILHKNAIKLIFSDLGLLDPHNYFEKELNSWIAFEKASESTKEKLLNLSNKWNRKWTRKFKEHIQEAFKSLKKGKTLRGSVTVPRSASSAGRSSSVSATTIMIPERVHPGSLAEVNPIEVVNYFCETQLEKDLKEMMVAQSEDVDKRMSEKSKSKNTVLFLPNKQRERAILRLGEASVTETSFDKFHLPPITPGSLSFDIGRVIKLALPKINLNPFPSPIDRYPLDQVLITLRHSAQKYFILERSHVANYA